MNLEWFSLFYLKKLQNTYKIEMTTVTKNVFTIY